VCSLENTLGGTEIRLDQTKKGLELFRRGRNTKKVPKICKEATKTRGFLVVWGLAVLLTRGVCSGEGGLANKTVKYNRRKEPATGRLQTSGVRGGSTKCGDNRACR